MRKARIAAVAAVLCLGCLSFSVRASRDGIPDPLDPPRLVVDLAGVLDVWQRDSLERELVAFDEATSNQISVVCVPDLAGYEVAEYAVRLANKWGIGSKRNNGVLILLKPRGNDAYVDVTIQIGRGLEGAIPDAYAARIIRNLMGPSLRQDRYMDAIARACEELMLLARGEISEPRDGRADLAVGDLVIIFLVLVVLLFVFLRRRGSGGGSHPGHMGGGSGFGPPFTGGPSPRGFGGFSGGGFGGSAGGGFGGFGGGSFGGGGASGRF